MIQTTLALSLFLATSQNPSPTTVPPLLDPGELTRIDTSQPGYVQVFRRDGALHMVLPHRGDLPAGLTIDNVEGLLDGRWTRDLQGEWHWVTPPLPDRSNTASFGTGSNCFAFDPPSAAVTSGDPFVHPPILHDSQDNAWIISSSTAGLHATQSNGHTGTWGPTTLLAGSSGASIYDAVIAPNDDITVIYRQIVMGTYILFAVRYTPGSGWGAPVIAHASPTFIQVFDITAMANNDLLLTFEAGVFGGSSFVKRFDESAGLWGTTSQVSPPGVNAFNSTIRSNAARTDHYLTFFSSGTGGDGLWSTRWNDATQSFPTATLIPDTQPLFAGLFTCPRDEAAMVVDSAGEATVFYSTLIGGIFYRIEAVRTSGGVWQPPHVFLISFGPLVELYLLDQVVDISSTDQVTCVVTVPNFDGDQYEVFGLHHRPGSGFDMAGPLTTLPITLPAFVSRARARYYVNDRLFAFVNQNAIMRGLHYNGVEWISGVVPVPQVDLSRYVLMAGGDELLLTEAIGPTVEARWLRGTTGFSDLRGGLAGTNGIPSLTTACDMEGGQPMFVQLTGAEPGQFGVLIYGNSRIDIDFGGGTLVPSVGGSFLIQTDMNGDAIVQGTWPLGPPAGSPFYFQYWVLDSGGPMGLAASNAASGTVR